MKILKTAKLTYFCLKVLNSHNKLTKTKDLSDKTFNTVLQDINKLENFMNNSNVDSKLGSDLVNFLKADLLFINNFINHNFEECLNISLSMNSKQMESAILNRKIDALMEVKARTPQEEFKEKYSGIENIVKSEAQKSPIKKEIYNGTNMALAFGSYLDGNKEEMRKYLTKQVDTYGIETIMKNENNKSQPWFYNNVTPKYIEFLTEFFTLVFDEKIGVKNKSTNKVKFGH